MRLHLLDLPVSQYGVDMADHTDDLRLAHILADDADSLTMSRFGARDLTVSTKPDHSEVTDADLAVEDSVRRTLSRMRSRDAVHGEERADTGDGPRRWIIDPIDGTANFLRGVPVWATLIALSVEDQIVASVVSAPALKRRWWAARGSGALVGQIPGLSDTDPRLECAQSCRRVLVLFFAARMGRERTRARVR